MRGTLTRRVARDTAGAVGAPGNEPEDQSAGALRGGRPIPIGRADRREARSLAMLGS